MTSPHLTKMSTQPTFDFTAHDILVAAVDPCERKHGGNSESVAAHSKVIHSKQDTYKTIMTLVRARGEFGATSKEVAYALGKQLNCLSGRFSELRQMGWLKDSGIRRDGAAVLVEGRLLEAKQ